MRHNYTVWILPLIAISGLLLFLPAPDFVITHWHHHVWDLGHVLLFSGWSVVLLTLLHSRGVTKTRQWLFILIFTLATGSAIEIIQMGLNREASLFDLFLDLCGALITLCFFTAFQVRPTKPLACSCLVIAGLTVAALASHRLAASLYDKYALIKQFPVLISAQSPLELNRLYGKPERYFAPNAINDIPAIGINFTTDRYSLIYMIDFPGNWSEYQYLKIQLHVSHNEPLPAVLSIEDAEHRSRGTRSSDRFNLRLILKPGSNLLNIPLDQVRQAPRERTLDVSQITRVNLYTMSLANPRMVYLKEIRLEQ
ncbi:MAG: VanZ family protein [Ketobacteraceae bacterium]|nr:VanZ family protein [Ketobacteraceae bacterium]